MFNDTVANSHHVYDSLKAFSVNPILLYVTDKTNYTVKIQRALYGNHFFLRYLHNNFETKKHF